MIFLFQELEYELFEMIALFFVRKGLCFLHIVIVIIPLTQLFVLS